VGPCHRSMALFQVAAGGDGHQARRVAANGVNKQCQIAYNGQFSAWYLREVLTTPHTNISMCYEIFYRSSVLGTPFERFNDTRGFIKSRGLLKSLRNCQLLKQFCSLSATSDVLFNDAVSCKLRVIKCIQVFSLKQNLLY